MYIFFQSIIVFGLFSAADLFIVMAKKQSLIYLSNRYRKRFRKYFSANNTLYQVNNSNIRAVNFSCFV